MEKGELDTPLKITVKTVSVRITSLNGTFTMKYIANVFSSLTFPTSKKGK